jgi:hypothetical protein
MTCASKKIGATWARMIRSSKWWRNTRPSDKTWVGVGIKPLASLYPGGTKRLGPLDGPWVGLVIELLRELYLGGSDGFDLSGSGVPIGA